MFLLDITLPGREVETTIVANEFAKKHRRGSIKVYQENVILITSDGSIMVSNSQLRSMTTNHKFDIEPTNALLYKTLLFGIGAKIIIPKFDNLTLENSRPSYGFLLFIPIIMFILGIIVWFTRTYNVIIQIGSFNLVLAVFYLILLFTNLGEIGLDEY